MCAPCWDPFDRNRVFSIEVSQKWQNLLRIAAASKIFQRSHAAWESNFAKVAFKALGNRHFHFGGELGVLSGILAFFVLFGGVGRSSGVLARDRMQKVRKCSFSGEVSQKVANCRTSRAERILF